MSATLQSRILVFLGVITATLTIASNVMTLGELKGIVQTKLSVHEHTLDLQANEISQHGKEIAEIKGKLHGIASQVGKMPARVAQQLKQP